MKIQHTGKYLVVILILSFFLFLPSLFTFYTNDDFFLLKIAQANNLGEFLNFFNLLKGPEGLGMYRPLTTQVFYFLGWKFFNLNPIYPHLISMGVFLSVICLVFKLSKMLTGNDKISLLAAFLYGTSATHFGQLYYLAVFQELGMTFFFLLSTIFFIKFIEKPKLSFYIASSLLFIFSLLSKETAVILPFALILVYFLLRAQKETLINLKRLILSLTPYLFLLAVYFYMRFTYFGFASGDSYIWDFSVRKALNTLSWYGLWSLNLPEMLVDYIGPGLHFNPNLFKFWSKEIIPIFILFGLQISFIFYLLVKFLRKKQAANIKYPIIIYSFAWFVLGLVPVLFLPIHKFAFYLTLPLIGVVLVLSYLFSTNYKVLISFIIIWLSVSLLSLNITYKTHWIISGSKIAERVHQYLLENKRELENDKTIVFYDTPRDEELPWKPSGVVKVILSDRNYFSVFWGGRWQAKYVESESQSSSLEGAKVEARRFLGY